MTHVIKKTVKIIKTINTCVYCSLTLMDVVCIIYSFYTVMDHVFIISFAIYTLYVYDRIIKTIYIHFQSIFITYTEVLPIVL